MIQYQKKESREDLHLSRPLMKKKEPPHSRSFEDLSIRRSRIDIRFNNFTLTPPITTSMSVFQSGHKSECPPGWHTRMTTYDHYILHYIISGKGTYYAPGGKLPVNEGELFLIRPFEAIHYQADLDKPWTYYWVGFNGAEAPGLLNLCGFSETCLIRSCPKDDSLKQIFSQLAYPRSTAIAQEYELLGNLYHMFSLLIETHSHRPTSKPEQYLSTAVEYIQQNYLYSDLKVRDVADFVGIDRTYLYRLFFDTFQMSVQDFILEQRLKKAASLLQHSSHSIGLVAFHCGFENQSYFSTVFKKHYGRSPAEYRKEQKR